MKKTLLLLFGMGFLLLALSSVSLAQFYELSFPGTAFLGRNESTDYSRNYDESHKSSSSGWLICPVIFPASAGGMNVSRLSASFIDNTASAQLQVQIVKIDRWSGNWFIVADVSSGLSYASASVSYMNQAKSQMSATGIDNNRWAWAFWAYFGDTPIKLHSVTVRYQ
jgi:hypothetical protein